MKIGTKPIIIAAAAGTFALGLGGYVWREENRPHILEIYIFAMSSGRSIFIRTPEDNRILIDGGSNSDIIRRLTEILPFYTRRIDSIISTNSDGKNVTGLIEVLNRYNVKDAYVPGLTLESLKLSSSTDQTYETLLATLADKNIPVHEAMEGNTLLLGNKISVKILFPVDAKKFQYSKASAPEVLFRLSYGFSSVVFMGNASVKVQKYVASSTYSAVAMPAYFAADSRLSASKHGTALIVSHSGLPANMSAQLIEQINPEYLIYSKFTAPVKAPKEDISTSAATSSKVSKKKVKVVEDPFTMSDGRRFNLKEGRTIKIVSDGAQTAVIPI